VAKRGKLYRANAEKLDKGKKYDVGEAFTLLAGQAVHKFDEMVDVAFRLGVDPKQSDQMVRGATVLPHGIGKEVKVVVVATGEAAKAASDAGADEVGHKDIIEKIEKGWLGFDRIVATPETIRDLTKVARILGPKGLMPSKKTGTVTPDVGKAVAEQKKGKVAFKVEKSGIVHAVVGRKSFGADKLKENFLVLCDNILKQKPTTAKGTYLKSVVVSSSMGPGIRLDTSRLEARTETG